jgi:hypothetical protein
MPANYFQLYGVEPFDPLGTPLATDYGGGAKVTNDNFLITLWNITEMAEGLPVAGGRIKPVWETVSGAVDAITFGPGQKKNTFASRLSTRFRLQGLEPVTGSSILAVLQTPRQDFTPLANPLAALDPASPGGFTLNLNINPMISDCLDVELHQPYGIALPAVSGAPISDVPVDLVDSIGMKTNGADGVFPTFYAFSSAAAAVAVVNEVKLGAAFYLGVVIGPAVGYAALDVIIRWPHSGGRG